MAAILDAGCQAQIRLSIVQPVMIDMVNDKTSGNVYYTAVHVDSGLSAFFTYGNFALCVTCAISFINVPLVPAEGLVIIGVDDGEFAL